MERLINRIAAYFWLSLAVLCGLAILLKGAWWHLLACAVCVMLYRLFLADSKTE